MGAVSLKNQTCDVRLLRTAWTFLSASAGGHVLKPKLTPVYYESWVMSPSSLLRNRIKTCEVASSCTAVLRIGFYTEWSRDPAAGRQDIFVLDSAFALIEEQPQLRRCRQRKLKKDGPARRGCARPCWIFIDSVPSSPTL